jgi:6-phosphogluconolactonase
LYKNPNANMSRRNFLKGAAALPMADPAIARGGQSKVKETQEAQQAPPSGKTHLLYVGSGRSSKGPKGRAGHGQGICLFEMDSTTGALTQRAFFASPGSPSWLALNPAKTHLYSCGGLRQHHGKPDGGVTAYAINSTNGHLTELNTVSSEGAGPAHMSVHPSGRYALVANYSGGSVAVLPIRSNGELGPATDVHVDKGAAGPQHAVNAPQGSFAISGHDTPHVHMIHADPSGKRVLSTDLGTDKIMIWNFDAGKGKLTPNNPPWVSVPPGDGPRHFVFDPNARWLYCIQEEGSAVVVFDYDEASGKLTQKQVISTLPMRFAGTNYPSAIRISPNARFIYGANRLHDTIAFYSIGNDGKLSYVGEEWTRGDYSPSFIMDPSGSFLFSCNTPSDNITAFRVNGETGHLTFTDRYTPVGAPINMVFLR